ncbi:MAG: hypothetical protein R3301_15965, partial [Saprospiraceae bacterium]|nr:hypothetical protein [Saprospiraceae bacterium]
GVLLYNRAVDLSNTTARSDMSPEQVADYTQWLQHAKTHFEAYRSLKPDDTEVANQIASIDNLLQGG